MKGSTKRAIGMCEDSCFTGGAGDRGRDCDTGFEGCCVVEGGDKEVQGGAIGMGLVGQA